MFDRSSALVEKYELWWCRELRNTLKKMDVETELKPLVDDQVFDVFLPQSNVVVMFMGFYSYYMSTTNRIVYSKFY